jgi:tetratricopeptide (TPR) repeat protein
MRAAIRVQEAVGFAQRRNEDTAQRLLDEALGWAADDSDGDARGGHGSFCTSGYIEAHRAQCLVLLRSPQRAIRHYEQALPALAPVYRRDRAAALAGKATAHAAADQPEEAAATARTALPMARRAGSQRIVRRLAAVGATLYPHRNLEAVAGLLHELDEVAS